VRKLEEAEEMDMPSRKASVSTSCQTEKVSRRVSHSANLTSIQGQELTPVTRTVRTTVGQRVVSQSGEQILKECNNTLVTFIDKARILAEAREVRAALPATLKERISIEVNVGDAFDDEIRKLKMKIEESRKIKETRVSELAQVKEENAELIKKHEENKAALQEVERELFRLETAESELEAKIGSTNIRLQEKIRQLEAEIISLEAKAKESAAAVSEIEESKVENNFSNPEDEIEMKKMIGKMTNEKSSEERAFIIKIKNEFLEKMKAALHKVRLEYQQDYQKFILKIETESDEIMRFYEGLIQARLPKNAAAMQHSSLIELEKMRNYQGRINQLDTDRNRLEEVIRNMEGSIDHLELEYKDQLAALDQQLVDLKARLRSLFEEFSSFAKWKYGHSHEVTIYSRLMQYEQNRLEETKPPKQVSVTERTERIGQSVDMVLDREGQTMQYGEKKEMDKRPRRESGYKSSGDKTPDGTLERGLSLGNRDSFLADLESSL